MRGTCTGTQERGSCVSVRPRVKFQVPPGHEWPCIWPGCRGAFAAGLNSGPQEQRVTQAPHLHPQVCLGLYSQLPVLKISSEPRELFFLSFAFFLRNAFGAAVGVPASWSELG